MNIQIPAIIMATFIMIDVLFLVIARKVIIKKSVAYGMKEQQKFMEEAEAFTKINPDDIEEGKVDEVIARRFYIANEIMVWNRSGEFAPKFIQEKTLAYQRAMTRKAKIVSSVFELIVLVSMLVCVVQVITVA
jgi:hypothetical protein